MQDVCLYSRAMKNILDTVRNGANTVRYGIATMNCKTMALMGTVAAAALPVCNVFAEGDVFSATGDVIKTIYKGVLSISTILAVCCVVICCLFMMLSSNPKTVETSKSWLKRILIDWIVINALGLIVTSLRSWLSAAGADQFDIDGTTI